MPIFAPVVAPEMAAELTPPVSEIRRRAGVRHQTRTEIGGARYLCSVSVVGRGDYLWTIFGHRVTGDEYQPAGEWEGRVLTVARGLEKIAGVLADLLRAEVLDLEPAE